VSNPRRIREPQNASTLPTKDPRKSGAGKPIFSNLPAPRSPGNRNFCIPSDKNTMPTINRIRMVVCVDAVDSNLLKFTRILII
jgi:hypothetical protein